MDAVAREWRSSELGARERAMSEYAAKLTHTPHGMAENDLEAMRRAGLSDREILDVAHVVGFFAYANRLVDGLGCDLEPSMWESTEGD